MSHFRYLSICLSALIFSGCASYTDETREVISAYRSANYEQSLQKLDSSGIKEQSRNRLLYLLERAMILDRMGKRDESRQLLIKADKVVDQLYTVSISKEAATYIYNESASDYSGEDYEKVAIHSMLAHSFIADGNLAAARVEAARINSRLNEINSSYEDNKNRYKEDAYARYLAGMIYEALGEDDNAIVDYRLALKAYESDYRKFFATEPPDHMVEALSRLLSRRNRGEEARALRDKYKINDSVSKEPMAEIAVIHEVAEIDRKERAEFVVPISNQIVRFSFPVIKQRHWSFGRTGVTVEGGPSVNAELGENLNMIASQTLEDRRLRLMAKSAARLLLKGQLAQKAKEEFGILGLLAGNIYGAVTETADTRSWGLLPAAFYVSRVKVTPGEHELVLYNEGRRSDVRKVRVRAGELLILRD